MQARPPPPPGPTDSQELALIRSHRDHRSSKAVGHRGEPAPPWLPGAGSGAGPLQQQQQPKALEPRCRPGRPCLTRQHQELQKRRSPTQSHGRLEAGTSFQGSVSPGGTGGIRVCARTCDLPGTGIHTSHQTFLSIHDRPQHPPMPAKSQE